MQKPAGTSSTARSKPLTHSSSTARRNGLGTTIKYLRRTTSAAANNGLGIAIKYLVNQNAGAGNNWADVKAHIHRSRARIQMNLPVV
jgi:hypothetical protein